MTLNQKRTATFKVIKDECENSEQRTDKNTKGEIKEKRQQDDTVMLEAMNLSFKTIALKKFLKTL